MKTKPRQDTGETQGALQAITMEEKTQEEVKQTNRHKEHTLMSHF